MATDRHFLRRLMAAKSGMHLPSEEELLRGMPFFKAALSEDICEFAVRLGRRIKQRRQKYLLPVVKRLDDLSRVPSDDCVIALFEELDRLPKTKAFPVEACRLRCRIYLAFLGEPDAAFRMAGEMARLALYDVQHGRRHDMVSRSLGWAIASTYLDDWKKHDGQGTSYRVDNDANTHEHLFQRAFRAASRKQAEDWQRDDHDPAVDVERPLVEPSFRDEGSALSGSVVVIGSIGNGSTSQGKRVAGEFATLLNRPLALSKVPDLADVKSVLATEFPYAEVVVDKVLNPLAGRRHVWLHPTIFVGPPGCGKSRFARRLSEELRVPYEMISCGGMSDSAIGGASRRWSSGEPSLPVMAVRRHDCAGPIIILDEVEKVATSRHNGNAHDVLLGLLEGETAKRWHDPYIEAECNLAFVTWLMTANAVEPIPAVLRDRCRVLRFPLPGPEHVASLAPRILEGLYLEAGHDPRWATPLDALELDVLAAAWSGGSIRSLKRFLEGLLEAREQERSRQ
ncbi:AAA family ATPase [Oricola sp.]|uniref:AAA family ATPase n=1 Tax=Oricola sp. TaxID=1979950 RepID=UPI0025DFAF99|nr:AAA family ATPase [Oricola sp.]MCI5076409.1 AAA family ATPase [Oricola sp.]